MDVNNRNKCQYCRYMKCVSSGMVPNMIELQYDLNETKCPNEKFTNNSKCWVCYFTHENPKVYDGVQTCRLCKEFFKRSNNNLQNKKQLEQFSASCQIQLCNFLINKIFNLYI